MKIIQVISSLGNGGAEKFVVELSNELAKNNTVVLCSFKQIENWMISPPQLQNNVKLITFNKRKGIDLLFYLRLANYVLKSKVDVVNLHLDSTIRYFLPIIFFSNKLKFIYTIHSNLNEDKIELFNKLSKFKFIHQKVKFVCITSSIQNDFSKKYPHLNFVKIKNGVSKQLLSNKINDVKKEILNLKANSETKVFTIISNYSPPKNLSLIVNVFKELYLKNINAILLIIGNDSSDDKKEWKKIENIKCANTFMLGTKSNIQDYLNHTDAYCLCSIFEGLPISILESYSCGLPVLSTPVGGIPNILNHKVNGLLSADLSLESYYNMILEFINLSEMEIKKIKQNNILLFETEYNITKTANNYISIYNN